VQKFLPKLHGDPENEIELRLFKILVFLQQLHNISQLIKELELLFFTKIVLD